MANHLCADESGRCAAVVATAGDKCPVHQRAMQGPYASPCERCGKKIGERDLWVRAKNPQRPADDIAYPWHYDCRPGRAHAFKAPRAKKSWSLGLGLFEEPTR